MIQMTDLVHQVIVLNNTFLLVSVEETIEIGEITIEINTIVIGTSNQEVISPLVNISKL